MRSNDQCRLPWMLSVFFTLFRQFSLSLLSFFAFVTVFWWTMLIMGKYTIISNVPDWKREFHTLISTNLTLSDREEGTNHIHVSASVFFLCIFCTICIEVKVFHTSSIAPRLRNIDLHLIIAEIFCSFVRYYQFEAYALGNHISPRAPTFTICKNWFHIFYRISNKHQSGIEIS